MVLVVAMNPEFEDELCSNCDTKESVDEETNSNCDTCLVRDESVRPDGMNSNSISLEFVNYTWQPFHLENGCCNKNSVQDS